MKCFFEKLYFQHKIIKKRDYFLGFLFSFLLTVIPFLLVSKNFFSKEKKLFLIIMFCLLQVIVHLKYFFRFNLSNYDNWSILFAIFTFLVLSIIIFGSILIMYNLNYHMIK